MFNGKLDKILIVYTCQHILLIQLSKEYNWFALDINYPLHDSCDFFVARRKEILCGVSTMARLWTTGNPPFLPWPRTSWLSMDANDGVLSPWMVS